MTAKRSSLSPAGRPRLAYRRRGPNSGAPNVQLSERVIALPGQHAGRTVLRQICSYRSSLRTTLAPEWRVGGRSGLPAPLQRWAAPAGPQRMCGRPSQVTSATFTFPHRNPGVGWAARTTAEARRRGGRHPKGRNKVEDPAHGAGLPFAEAGLAGSAGHPTSGVSHKDAVARSATPARSFDIYAR